MISAAEFSWIFICLSTSQSYYYYRLSTVYVDVPHIIITQWYTPRRRVSTRNADVPWVGKVGKVDKWYASDVLHTHLGTDVIVYWKLDNGIGFLI